jgi:glycosyltransferase involved in cell wall biosynthesis
MPVSELIASFDASASLVHTPQSEVFGLVVAEALARNFKLFGFKTGGVRDIAQGAAGMILVAPDDWSALEREISAWLARGCPLAPPLVLRPQDGRLAAKIRQVHRPAPPLGPVLRPLSAW